MDIYQTLFSSAAMFNEQLAQELIEVLPEQGVLFVIRDSAGQCWFSEESAFTSLGVSETFLHQLCSLVDDGAEPAVAYEENCSFIAGQLSGENENYGYMILVLPQNNPEDTIQQFNLIEMIFNQYRMIVRLIEQNRRLYEIQMKRYHQPADYQVIAN